MISKKPLRPLQPKRLASAGAFVALTIASSHALAQSSPAIPDALQPYLKTNNKLHYLGKADGLPGYLIEPSKPSESNQNHTIYLTPNGKLSIMGHAYTPTGDDATAMQISRLQSRVADIQSGRPVGAPLDIANDSAATGTSLNAPAAQQMPLTPTTTAQSPAPPQTTAPSSDQIEAEKEFVGRLKQETARFLIRMSNPVAPTLYLLTPVSTPEAWQTWQMIKPLITSGKANLIVVPLPDSPANYSSATALIMSASPAHAWTYRTSATDFSTDPAAYNASITQNTAYYYIQKNEKFIETIGASTLPILAYMSKNGQWTITTGVPSDLSDLPL